MKRWAVLIALVLSPPAWGAPADGWITHPDAASVSGPIVLHFRRVLDVAKVPKALPVTVTADNRFILFVNGKRVATGPSTGTLTHWRTEELDLAPYLKPAAMSWRRRCGILCAERPNGPGGCPPRRRLAAAGRAYRAAKRRAWFPLTGDGVATGDSGWRVKIDAGHSAGNGRAQVPRGRYYVASAPEVIDAAKADWNWTGGRESGGGWVDAVAAPQAANRTLIADPLPQQSFVPAAPGVTVRSDLGGDFPKHPLTVSANSHARILLRREAMISGYPELTVSGGAGATIKLAYTEALYDADLKKSDRDLVESRQALGIFDTFLSDGARRSFMPLWWRTWRYAELDIETGATPLALESLRVHETSYPFRQVAHFTSSDPQLNKIWQVGWRTALIDAHETYMDSAYWEQLQYTGDTRLQMLISYAVTGDPRLAQQAIEAFAESDVEGGLEQGAYPSRSDNVIATFSLAWVGMLADWSMEQPDTRLIMRNLPRMRTILKWFEPWRAANGLLGKNPQWNFIDWAGPQG